MRRALVTFLITSTSFTVWAYRWMYRSFVNPGPEGIEDEIRGWWAVDVTDA